MDTTSLRVRFLWLNPPILGPVVRIQYPMGEQFSRFLAFFFPDMISGTHPRCFLQGFHEHDRIDAVNPGSFYRMLVVVPHTESLAASEIRTIVSSLDPPIRQSVEEFLNYPDERIETALHLVRYHREILRWDGRDACRGAYDILNANSAEGQHFEIALFSMRRLFRLTRRLDRAPGSVAVVETKDIRAFQDLQVFDRPFEFSDIKQVIKFRQHLFIEDVEGRLHHLRTFKEEPQDKTKDTDASYRDTGNRLLDVSLLQEYIKSEKAVTFSVDFLRRHIMQNHVDMLKTAVENIPHRLCDWISVSESDFYLLVWDDRFHKGEIHKSTLGHRESSNPLVRFDVVPGGVPISFCHLPALNLFFLALQDDSNIYILDWDEYDRARGSQLRVVVKPDPAAGVLVDLSILTDEASGSMVLVAVHTTCVVLYHLSVLDHE